MDQEKINSITQNLSKSDLIELRKACQNRIDEILREEQEQAKKQKVTALKVINRGEKIYFIGRYTNCKIAFGGKVTKVKDGKKYMHIIFGNTAYNVLYSDLSPTPPTEREIEGFNIMKKILS